MTEDTRQFLLEEFKEAGHLHRLHLSLMFGHITVFLGASGGLIYRLTNQPPIDPLLLRLLALFGVFLAFLFLILHERVYAYSHGARRRAEEVQKILGLELYSDCPTHIKWLRSFRAAAVTRTLYVGAALFWLYLVVVGPSGVDRLAGVSKTGTSPAQEATAILGDTD